MRHRRHNRRLHVRSGVTLMETGIALVVMATAMLAVVQLVQAAARQRRARIERQVALLELSNQAERLSLLSWDETDGSQLTTWSPSEMALSVLQDPQCSIRVVEEEPASRRIELALSWKDAGGAATKPVRLSTWKFAETGREP